MSTRRRVLVLGIGVVCPAGLGKEQCWEGLRAGRSYAEVLDWPEVGVRAIGCRADHAGLDEVLPGSERRRLDRIALLAAAAADEAVQDAKLGIDVFDPHRQGIVVGVGFGGIGTLAAQHRTLLESGWKRLSPLAVPAVMPSGAAALLAIRHHITGPVATVTSACASGAQAVGDAFRLIRAGDLDVALAGGAEAPLDPLPLAAFTRMEAMSKRFDDPATASRPFDRDRDGFVIGEGAAFFVLGTEEAAATLGAPVHGEVLGYGFTTDAHHLTAPDERGDGAARSMRLALDHAGTPMSSLTHINVHGTSTKLNDATEAAAIVRCSDGAPPPPIVAIKGAIGHLMGAAGAVELAASFLAAQHGELPPTVNHCEPDPEVDLRIVNEPQRIERSGPFLTTSFGFGGQNASLVVRSA